MTRPQDAGAGKGHALKAEVKRLREIEKAVKKFLRREDRAYFHFQLDEAIEQLRKSVEAVTKPPSAR